MKNTFTILFVLLIGINLYAQGDDSNYNAPLDDIAERKVLVEKRVLPYAYQNERDILWEKRIWREIDTRQLKNLTFRYEKMPFFQILLNEVRKGSITAYSSENDEFTTELCWNDLKELLYHSDTIRTFDPETYEEVLRIVNNDPDPHKILKYRIKEMWWVDTKYSRLNVRILGIAPVQEIYDEHGNFRYEQPLFWIYYPHARQALSNYKAYNPFAEASPMSWEDWLEMRFFDSYITKESNVYDRRLSDYLSAIEVLRKGEKIKEQILNYELDLWSH